MGPHPDEIPLNGVRVRFQCLTNLDPVLKKAPRFNGSLRWYGFSERFNYEINGGFPFVHRRILFKSSALWPVQSFTEVAREGGDVYCRSAARSLVDINTSGCLGRLIGSTNVRGLLYTQAVPGGLSVIEDKKIVFNGKEGGLMRTKKFWNAFGSTKKGVVMKYRLDDSTGSFPGVLEDSSVYQHHYVVDIFQYGIDGMDLAVPTPQDLAAAMESAPPTSKLKRPKLEKSDIDMDSVKGALEDGVGAKVVAMEDADEGRVKVVSTLKLYWYDP